MQNNPLFKGLTRPPMIFGVPMTPLFVVMCGIFLLAFYSQNIFLLAFAIPTFFIMKAMTKRDDFIFRLMFLKMRFFSNPASKNYYKAKTYSANSYREMPKNSDFPKISVFGLKAEPSFEKLIPFSSLISDSVVITKNYFLISTWEIKGINFEAEEDDELDTKNDLLNMLFKSFANEPVSFYFHNCRYSIEDRLTSKFNNAFLEEIDRKYYESFKQGTLRKNALYLTLIFDPLKVKIEKTAFMKSSFESKRKMISLFLMKFGEFTDRLEANLKDFSPKRLKTYSKDNKTYSHQLEFYNYLIGGKFNPIRVLSAPIDQYLNGNLQNIQFGHETIQFNSNHGEKRFARCIEIKDYTSETFAGILDVLMYLDIEYIITQSFSPIPRIDAKSAISKQKKQLIATEDDGFSQVAEIDDALDQLTNGEISFGKYHFSILVYGDSLKECKDNANEVITRMNELGFGVTLATIALPATFFSQLPTNFAIRPRINLISSLNYSSLIALHNFAMGKRNKNCWGDAVTILKTPNKQPYYFNFHQSSGASKNDFGDFFLANTLILGQSGGGKTVFMNFIVNQMMKYANKDTFPDDVPEKNRKFTAVYLDKDKGALGNILCAGGRYISIENGKPTGFNPFMVETTQENIRQLQSLIKLLVTRNNEILTTREEEMLNNAVNSIMKGFDKEERKFPISLLLENLTENVDDDNSLKSRLALFKRGKQFGWVFDNEFDNLDFPDDINLFGIDGTEFLDDKDVSGILSYYILWRVMSLTDGRRLCIDIDEAWKWLENEIVQEEVKNKFKTIRKQNGFLRLASQSLEDFLKLKNAKTLIEQSATMVFLPNPKAKDEEYVDGVGLSYDEYMIIKGFDPAKRQFLVKRQDEKAICTLDLSSLGNENLKILSTGTTYIDTIEKIFAQEDKSLDEKVAELKEFYRNE
ncbi:VirB4 family type IV secretion/conjugal transfer ATPase [Helicobacter sp. MIT 11-5569]|jgi:type IV secretion system protein VirB4|uniref:VirB4 family type IV secretion/conjugal transfer ATPase n=1 Tax=Helicobacter TaxID=209 RepID=UPI00047C84E8|nr:MULTISPECIES: VirB4 family type IV secretion/conjugal transfer ATPase [Helicobacter]TLD80756.1 VirB4 family type IV secretion/conjugal transfer ATPase [Helicobacter sp. MIT 11-5569]